MIKKRMALSLVALVGSVFLFVIASFAWFAISNDVDVSGNIFNVTDIDVAATLYVSDDDITYVEATSIDFQNQVPGDIKYYKIVVTNNNDYSINSQVSLYGFTDSATDESGDTTNYTEGRSLADVILLNSSNNINTETIVDQTLMTTMINDSTVITHDNVTISALGTAEFYFSFTMSTDAGNNYQNLGIDIASIRIQSVKQG